MEGTIVNLCPEYSNPILSLIITFSLVFWEIQSVVMGNDQSCWHLVTLSHVMIGLGAILLVTMDFLRVGNTVHSVG